MRHSGRNSRRTIDPPPRHMTSEQHRVPHVDGCREPRFYGDGSSAVRRHRRQKIVLLSVRCRGVLQRLRYARGDRSKNRGPKVSRLASEPPSPRCAAPGKGGYADPFCLPCPSTVQCFGRGVAGAARAELSALQPPALCGAGAHLQPLGRAPSCCPTEAVAEPRHPPMSNSPDTIVNSTVAVYSRPRPRRDWHFAHLKARAPGRCLYAARRGTLLTSTLREACHAS